MELNYRAGEGGGGRGCNETRKSGPPGGDPPQQKKKTQGGATTSGEGGNITLRGWGWGEGTRQGQSARNARVGRGYLPGYYKTSLGIRMEAWCAGGKFGEDTRSSPWRDAAQEKETTYELGGGAGGVFTRNKGEGGSTGRTEVVWGGGDQSLELEKNR